MIAGKKNAPGLSKKKMHLVRKKIVKISSSGLNSIFSSIKCQFLLSNSAFWWQRWALWNALFGCRIKLAFLKEKWFWPTGRNWAKMWKNEGSCKLADSVRLKIRGYITAIAIESWHVFTPGKHMHYEQTQLETKRKYFENCEKWKSAKIAENCGNPHGKVSAKTYFEKGKIRKKILQCSKFNAKSESNVKNELQMVFESE